MAESNAPDESTSPRTLLSTAQIARERIFSFGVVYVGIFVFVLFYLSSVRLCEHFLRNHFGEVAAEVVDVSNLDRPIATQIQQRVRRMIDQSRWVRWGGVEVTTLVLASDGATWLYVDGHVVPQPLGLDPTDVLREAVALLPATANVEVRLPHNALLANTILIFYAALLLQVLYLYNRAAAQRESRRMAEALAEREQAAQRAAAIENDLAATRRRLSQVEPTEREQQDEIRKLQRERSEIEAQLASLSAREETLRGQAARAVELSQEVSALEDLLDEASGDLDTKDEAIRDLEKNLKRAARGSEGSGRRSRAGEALARRLRTLYPTLEIDARALNDILALRDESMKLKAEERMKRLSEEAENVAVRRKVGGLPERLSIFELGFAGKGRIYYTRGRQNRFRILAIGAKNSQDSDLDYLRRIDTNEKN